MKATGIVRKIDDLGRVVIPKEIRRTMKIHEGDPLEIYTDKNGEVIFKKYSMMEELSSIANKYADILFKISGFPTVIIDKDNVIAVSGTSKKDLLDRKISLQLEKIINENPSSHVHSQKEPIVVVDGDVKYSIKIMYPVISAGDCVGAVILLSDEKKSQIGETEEKLVNITAKFLGAQIE